MFIPRKIGELFILQSDLFPLSIPHAFTTRRTALNKSEPSQEQPNFRLDSLPESAKWWIRLRDLLYTSQHICIVNKQVHSGRVRILDPLNPEGEEKTVEGFRFRVLGEGDAIVKPFSRVPMFLGITTADCLPCLVLDKETGAIGVVHAGWRGLGADIVGNVIKAFKKLGSKTTDLLWAVGPSIDMENYQVGPEVIAALEAGGLAESDWRSSKNFPPGWIKEKKGNRYKLNLAACLKIRLHHLGVPEENMDFCTFSTFTNQNMFYSYRRDKGILGLQASVIG